MNIKKTLAEAITQHTGQSVTPEQVKFMRDPQVSGTYAARVAKFYEDGEHMDCLFILGSEAPTVEGFDEALEEVEYTSWPPVSGNLQFFV